MDRLDELIVSVRKLHEEIAVVRAEIGYVKENGKKRDEMIQELDEAIRGNGKEGLNSQVSVIKKWIDNQIWFQRLIIGVVITEVIGLIFLFIHTITNFIK